MKRFASMVLALTMLLSLVPASYAASDEANEAAQALYELGLFNGVGTNADGTPIFDLDRSPTRQEAITMLVRLLGKEEGAKSGTWETPFTDVDDWAKPYVGYAYANGLAGGTSPTTFSGNDTVTASQYLTFILRALGYEDGTDFQWDKAWELSDKIKLTDGRYNAKVKEFTRGDVAIISCKALSTTTKATNQSLSDVLGISTESTPSIDINNLQGAWISASLLDDKYEPQLDLYYVLSDRLENSYYVFEGNSFVFFTVGTTNCRSWGDPFDSGSVNYETGTFTIDGDEVVLQYENSYSGRDTLLNNWKSLEPISITDKSKSSSQEKWKISSLSNSELKFSYSIYGREYESAYVKVENAPLYNTYHALVTAFEENLQRNAVDSLSAPVITSVYQETVPVLGGRGLRVNWDTVPNAEGYELWYREGEFGKWFLEYTTANPYDTSGSISAKEGSYITKFYSHGATIYFKVRAYTHNTNGEIIYSDYSNIVYAIQP